MFYSSWVFISTALLSILVAPSIVTALTAYLEVRNPIVLGIETEAEHEHALALLKSRHIVWLFAQKDVVTAAQIYLRIMGESLIKNENVEIK